MLNTEGTRPLSWYGNQAPDYLDGEEADDTRPDEYDRADAILSERYDRGSDE